jgi:hypothetical protein
METIFLTIAIIITNLALITHILTDRKKRGS